MAVLSVAGAVSAWLLTRDALEDEEPSAQAEATGELDCASLRAVLDELTRRFFGVAREVATVSKDIREKIKALGQDIPDDKALRTELARQCKVPERFAQIREEVLSDHGVSELTVARLSEADADAVRQHREGVEKMLEDALGGLLPTLPGLEVPAALTADRLLGYHSEMLQLKLAKVKQLAAATQGKRYSPEELGQAAALISQAAEAEVLEAHREHLGKHGEVFHSAVAQRSRDAEFRKRMAEADAQHRRELVAAFRA